MDDRKAYTDGLRAMADYFDKHPDLPLPSQDISCIYFGEEENQALAMRVARALRCIQKSGDDTFLHISRKFGPVVLDYLFIRDNVCHKRVVGTRKVKKNIAAASIQAVEVEEDIVEWDCPPLLKLPTKEEAPPLATRTASKPDAPNEEIPF